MCMKKLLLTLIVLGVVGVLVVRFWYGSALKPVAAFDESRQTVKIEQGMIVSTIADLLEEKELIRSSAAFAWYVRSHNITLQAGQFVLQPSMSAADIAEVLQTGKAEEMIVTIPEGFTVTDIDALLAEKDLIEPGDFLACAQECDLSAFTFLPNRSGLADRGGQVEGYLFPDTYFVIAADLTAESFLKRLLQTFEQKVVEGLATEIDASPRSLHDVVTMASLIEEEASNDEERPVIAGILWKRYDEGMGLGVDATVRYIVNKPTAAITLADLNTNSPYNTRKFKGLPPGPISSVGLASIRASLEPEDSSYWYYLHGNDGQIRYAETNEEHNVNRFLYLD